MIEDKRYFLTGAHGFIGNALTDRLISEGKIIYPINRQLHLPSKEPDYVYYLASYGNYHDQKDVAEMSRVNVENFLKLCRATNPKLMIYFSSSSVYGHHRHKLSEKHTLLFSTDYAWSKVVGENVARVFSKKMPMVIIRPFSVTGVGEQDRHLIPTAIKCAFTGEILDLDPFPVHDFVDIYDLLSGLQIIENSCKGIIGLNIFNICSGKQYSNEEVVKIIENVTEKKIKIKLVDNLRSYDSTYWVGDNSKLKSLGWSLKFTLEDTIKDMVKDYVTRNEK